MQIKDYAAFQRLLVAIRSRGWRHFTREDDHDQVAALGLPPWHCWPSWANTPEPPADEAPHTMCAKTWATAHAMRVRLDKLANGRNEQ